MSGAMNTKRRDFLKSAGGIAVAFSWSVPTVLAQQAARPDLPGSLGTNRMLDGWIRVNPAGTVTVSCGSGVIVGRTKNCGGVEASTVREGPTTNRRI